MSGEMKVNRWRLPLLIGVGVGLAATIAIGVGVLVAHDQKAGRSPAAFAPSQSASASAGLDRAGKIACDLNYLAVRQNDLLDPDAVGAIVAASKESSDEGIRIKAVLLSEVQKVAIAAKGREDAGKFVTKLSQASDDLRSACAAAGYSAGM